MVDIHHRPHTHIKVVRHGICRLRREVELSVVVVEAQAEREAQTLDEQIVETQLLEQRRAERGRFEVGEKGEAVVRKRQPHSRAARQARADTSVEETDAVFLENHGAVGLHLRISRIDARGPLHTLAFRAFQRNLFGHAVHFLPLLERINIGGNEILVHEEAVAQVLVRRDAAQGEFAEPMLHAQPRVEKLAAVTGLAVGFNISRGGHVSHFPARAAHGVADMAIGAGPFVRLLERCRPVHLYFMRGLPREARSSAAALHAVGVLAERVVGEVAVAPVVERADRDAEVFGGVQVGDGREAAAHRLCGKSCRDVRALLHQGVGGVDADKAARRVASVERALRTAQHVHARHVEEVEIVGALVEIGHVVHVQTHGRRVDARADAADIYGRGEFRAVFGHIEVGHGGREAFHVRNVEPFERGFVEQAYRNGLSPQRVGLLGRCHHHGFLNVNVF